MMYQSSGAQMETLKQHIAKTFGWMFSGLLLTFGVMIGCYQTGIVTWFLSIPAMAVLAILELGTVLFLSARVGKLSVSASRILFFVYALLNGLTFSTYFLYFEVPVLVLSFGVTALYFGVMAAVGYFTKVDLSRLQPILVGGVVFLLICNLLGMLFGFGGMERLFCFVGVAIFLAFTAYDTQKIKALYEQFRYDGQMLKRIAIFSALQLYLDFVNLFLYILRLFSGRD